MVYGIHNELVTVAFVSQPTSLGGPHIVVTSFHEFSDAATFQWFHEIFAIYYPKWPKKHAWVSIQDEAWFRLSPGSGTWTWWQQSSQLRLSNNLIQWIRWAANWYLRFYLSCTFYMFPICIFYLFWGFNIFYLSGFQYMTIQHFHTNFPTNWVNPIIDLQIWLIMIM